MRVRERGEGVRERGERTGKAVEDGAIKGERERKADDSSGKVLIFHHVVYHFKPSARNGIHFMLYFDG